MMYASVFTPFIKKNVDSIMASDMPDELRYANMFTVLAYVQGMTLSSLVRDKIGRTVYEGPFQGMTLIDEALVGCFGPTLLGVYEFELRPVIEKIIAHPYRHVLNIGCSIGYYAVGLARRMPQTAIHAFDIEPTACANCTRMAALNNVSDRVQVSGIFPGEDFARYANEETLVVMDIEGAERDLLDPVKFPALQKMDILVEMHDCNDPGLSRLIPERFAATHDITIILNDSMPFPLEKILGPHFPLEHFDRLAVTMEGRSGPTPWAFMTRKK